MLQELKVAPQMLVNFTYAIFDEAGELQEQSDLPMSYIHAVDGKMFPKIEQALQGASVGDEISVKLAPAEGFGERADSMVHTEFLDNVPPEYRQIGAEAVFQNDSGETMSMVVTQIENGQLTLDGNHPFAGKTMTFVIKVIDIRPASIDEVEAGQQAGSTDPINLH